MCNVPEEVREAITVLWDRLRDSPQDDVPWLVQTLNDWKESLPAMPQPDWSQAPEWVEWWAQDSYGQEWGPNMGWYEKEPALCINGSWEMEWGEGMVSSMNAPDLPLGIDWRLTKQRRPSYV